MLRALLLLLALTIPVFAQNSGAPRTVIVFGDSITAGSALPKDQQAQVWVKLLEAQSAGTLTMINEGKGGRPTNSVAEFEAMLLRQAKADLLVIALGMNDSRDLTEGCVPKAVANVRAMIEKARAAYGEKLPVLLVGPTNINKSALGPTKPIGDQREAKLRELGDAFAQLASAAHSEYLSLFGVVPDTSLLKDGVHPDAAGNIAIAKAMATKLRTLTAR
jgi:acyl-CoA thioesterase-1